MVAALVLGGGLLLGAALQRPSATEAATVDYVLPNKGPISGGTQITITGTGFQTLTERNYVQRDLVGMWDAINNTGSGHSSTTTTWKDLKGSNDLTLKNFNMTATSGWTADSLYFDGVNDYAEGNNPLFNVADANGKSGVGGRPSMAVEIMSSKRISHYGVVVSFDAQVNHEAYMDLWTALQDTRSYEVQYSGCSAGNCTSGWANSALSIPLSRYPVNAKKTVSYGKYGNASTSSVYTYLDGGYLDNRNLPNTQFRGWNQSTFRLGASYGSYQSTTGNVVSVPYPNPTFYFGGSVNNLRIYGGGAGALSAVDIAYNNMVDQARFNGGSFDFGAYTTVTVGGTAATNVVVVNDTTITATVPAHAAGAVDVVVNSANDVQTFAGGYTYYEPMTISGISPDSGSRAGGQTVTITGTGIAPTSLPALKKVAIGSNYGCGISDDAVYCWGSNGDGQLSGTYEGLSQIRPTKIANSVDNSTSALPVDAVINDITITNNRLSNYAYIYVATDKGVYYMTGSDKGVMKKVPTETENSNSQLPNGVTITHIDADKSASTSTVTHGLVCAIASNNNVYCWGHGGYSGALGNGSVDSSSIYPKLVSKTNLGTATVKDIAISYGGGCLLANNNNIYCWGNGGAGRLGSGTSSGTSVYVTTPTKVLNNSDDSRSQLPAGVTTINLAAGNGTTCVSASDNNIYCWGNGSNGMIGNNSATGTNLYPQKVSKQGSGTSELPTNSIISGIHGGGYKMCATADSGVYCWGGGASSSYLTPKKIQDESENPSSQLPVATTMPINNIAVSNNSNNSNNSSNASYCALDATGKLYCWGYNSYGQVGFGNTSTVTYPRRISEMHFSVVLDPTGNPAACNNVSLAADQQSLTCTTSEHRIPGVVDVVVKNGLDAPQTLNQAYEYLAPTLTGISPSSGPTIGGTEITITGTNFIPSDKMIFVDDSMRECTRSGNDWSSTTIMTCVTPPDRGNPYPETNFYNTDSSDTLQRVSTWYSGHYQYLEPTITNVSPNSGPISGGTEITITGTNLEGPNGEITLGDSRCIIQNRTNTSITCHTTRHTAGSVDLRLSWAGVDYVSISEAFTYQAPVFSSITPNHGTVDGGTEVIITGDGFGEQSTGYDSSLFAGGSFYTIAGNEITEYLPDGSDRTINTSGIVGNISQVEAIAANSGNVLLILDDTGMIYVSTQNGAPQALDEIVEQSGSYTYPTGITHLIMGSSPYCYSSDYSSSFPDDTSDTWYSLSCSSFYLGGDNGLYGSLYFNYYHVPPSATGYSSYGYFSPSSAPTDCNIDAADSSYGFLHCSNDDTIRYNTQTVQMTNVTGEFKKFLGNGVMIDSNDRLYRVEYDSPNSEYFYQPLDMSLVTGDNLTPIAYGGSAFFVDEDNTFYQVMQYDDGTGTGTYIYGLQPYDFANNQSLDLSAVSGTINGLYSNSYSSERYVTTKEGQAYVGTYDGSTGKYILAPIDTLIPENITSAVVFGSSAEPVECAISSWTDNEIHCTTASHSAGLVGVAVNNGSYNSVKMPAIWADTDKPITNNNYVSNIQSGYYYEAAKITSITPNYGPIGGETSVTISGSGFGDYDMAGYDYSVVAERAFYTAQDNNITGYLEGGSEITVDTSALMGNIRQLPETGSEMLLVLDDTGKIYYKDANHQLVPIDNFVNDYPAGILNVVAFSGTSPLCYSSGSCSGLIVTGEDGLHGSISFNTFSHSGSFTNQNYYGVTCDIDAFMTYLTHCTDGTIYYIYNGQTVSLTNVNGEFDKFVTSSQGGTIMTTKGDHKPYYLDTSDPANYKMMPVDMTQFAGNTIVMIDGTYRSIVISDENGILYQIINANSSTSVPIVEPYNQGGDYSVDFSLIDGVINQIVTGRQFSSSQSYYYITTTDGRFFTNDVSTGWGGWTNAQIPVTVPADTPRSVVFDRNGTPAECLVTSWSNTEIQCSTTEHDAGLVSVSINNGAGNSTELPATCSDNQSYGGSGGNGGTSCNGSLDNGETRSSDRTNIVSGFMYEEIYISLAVSSSEVKIGGTNGLIPTPSGTFGYASSMVTTSTNNPKGYSLSISTDKPNTNTNAKDLKHLTLNQYITGTTNTCTWSPGNTNTPGSLTNTTNTLANNTWGFSLDLSRVTAQQLCQVPASDNPLTIKQTKSPNETGDSLNIFFGAKVNLAKPSGQYQTTVVYTAVAET